MENISFWHWFIIAVIFIGLESLAPIAYLMWLGVAALIQGVITYLFIDDPILQIFSYSILALLVTIFGRRFVPIHIEKRDQQNINRRLDDLIGKRVILSTPMINGQTQIKIGSSVWNATGPDAPAGTVMIIESVDGVKVILKRES